MSEVVTVSGASETIYGTQAAAILYLQLMLGSRYDAWRALSSDDQKRALATVRRYLDRYSWISTADTFAERDALTDFVNASYELAAIAAEDASILTGGDDNVSSVSGGGVSLSFFSPAARSKLPDVVAKMLGKYLATVTATGGYAGEGGETSEFDEDNLYDPRGESF